MVVTDNSAVVDDSVVVDDSIVNESVILSDDSVVVGNSVVVNKSVAAVVDDGDSLLLKIFCQKQLAKTKTMLSNLPNT